jgi:Ca-activated chloride channel family protein
VRHGLPLLLAGLLWTGAAQADTGWSSLWRTDDQRGQQLLNQGKPADAAKAYADPRRKAYAELQAGDYAAAAQAFGRFDDSDAHYNRGNALAHSGDLQAALKAYDSALARNPDNQDARHNRDLVAQALKQQQQQNPQQSGQKNQQQDQQQNQQQSQQQQAQRQQGQQQQGQQQQGQQQQGQQQASSGQQQAQDAAGASQDASRQNSADKSSGKPDESQSRQTAQSQAAQPPQSAAQDQAQRQANDQVQNTDDAAQARRDVAAGLRQAGQDHQPASPGQSAQAGQVGDDAKRVLVKPPSEQQLAQDQWLRRIPDDPGGLLRRKFMIEHEMRQQDQQP